MKASNWQVVKDGKYSSRKLDFLNTAERLANSFSYRINSFVSRRRQRRDFDRYVKSGKLPFTPGYDVHKWFQIASAVADPSQLDIFSRGLALPDNYGHGIDERIVEYPWLISRLPKGGGTLLDAGSALNFAPLLNLPHLEKKVVHIVTLHPESNCFWQKGISYAFADLRDLPFRDNYYDQIVCISTLEHVGLNTEIYTNEPIESLQRGDYRVAAREIWRVLKPGGRLYLTMPFGQPCELDWLQQFDAVMVDDLKELLRPTTESVTYYKYDGTGWNVSSAGACHDSRYTTPESWSQDLVSNDYQIERAPVAAGAVVCLDLLK